MPINIDASGKQSTIKPSGGLWWIIITLAALFALLIAAGIGIQIYSILKHLGVTDILSAISLPDIEKVRVPIYLTFSVASISTAFSFSMIFLRRYARWCGYVSITAIASLIILLILPHAFGYSSPFSATFS